MYAQDIAPATVDEVIEKIARKVVEAKMEAPAILALESMKPLSWIGSQMGRIMVAPWLGVFGFDTMEKADMWMTIFEDRANVTKLVNKIEELARISDQSE